MRMLLTMLMAMIALAGMVADAGERKRLRRPGERLEKPVEAKGESALLTKDALSDPQRLADREDPAKDENGDARSKDDEDEEEEEKPKFRKPGERLNQRVLGRLETRLETRLRPSELPSTRSSDDQLQPLRTSTLPPPTQPR